MISKFNTLGLAFVNKVIHTCMGHFIMCMLGFTDTNIVHWEIQVRQSDNQNSATMDLWSGVDRRNIHQAELKPPCCHSVIGLELVWHCCQLQENPRCFLLPGLGGLWQFTRVQNCPKTLSAGYGVQGNPLHFYRAKTFGKKVSEFEYVFMWVTLKI